MVAEADDGPDLGFSRSRRRAFSLAGDGALAGAASSSMAGTGPPSLATFPRPLSGRRRVRSGFARSLRAGLASPKPSSSILEIGRAGESGDSRKGSKGGSAFVIGRARSPIPGTNGRERSRAVESGREGQ